MRTLEFLDNAILYEIVEEVMQVNVTQWWNRSLFIVFAMIFAGGSQAIELDSLPEMAVDVIAPMPGAYREQKIFYGLVGAAMFNTGRYIGSDERVSFPFPLMYFNYNDRVYWSIASAGTWLFRSDSRRFKFGLFAKGRGGVQGEYTSYDGIEDRDPSIDAGINILWSTQPITIGMSWLHDIGDRSDGESASLRLSRRFRLAERWYTTPSLVAEWQDHKLVDYYFGVDPEETVFGAPEYEGESSTNLRVAWTLAYRFTKRWSMNGGVSYTRLGQGLEDSPLTIRKHNTLVFVGASWSFFRIH